MNVLLAHEKPEGDVALAGHNSQADLRVANNVVGNISSPLCCQHHVSPMPVINTSVE